MSEALKPTTSPPSRRSILTSAVAAGVAAIVPVVTAAATTSPDPVLVIAAERDRLRAIYHALDRQVDAIRTANPAPMWGQGWPRVDRSLAVFRHTSTARTWPAGTSRT